MLVHIDQIHQTLKDIHWEIPGICQQICGNLPAALFSYQQSLREFPKHGMQPATIYRIQDLHLPYMKHKLYKKSWMNMRGPCFLQNWQCKGHRFKTSIAAIGLSCVLKYEVIDFFKNFGLIFVTFWSCNLYKNFLFMEN